MGRRATFFQPVHAKRPSLPKVRRHGEPHAHLCHADAACRRPLARQRRCARDCAQVGRLCCCSNKGTAANPGAHAKAKSSLHLSFSSVPPAGPATWSPAGPGSTFGSTKVGAQWPPRHATRRLVSRSRLFPPPFRLYCLLRAQDPGAPRGRSNAADGAHCRYASPLVVAVPHAGRWSSLYHTPAAGCRRVIVHAPATRACCRALTVPGAARTAPWPGLKDLADSIEVFGAENPLTALYVATTQQRASLPRRGLRPPSAHPPAQPSAFPQATQD